MSGNFLFKEKLLDPAGSFVPYGESKLANICHMQKLAKLKPNIGCFSLHPGVVKTELGSVFRIFCFIKYYTV